MKKTKAIINPIIIPMSSCDETQIPSEETTRAELLKHFEEFPKALRDMEEEMIKRATQYINMAESRSGYGLKNGSQAGRKNGGRGRNQTSTCRHPTIKKKR
jgi:hypothetical protein